MRRLACLIAVALPALGNADNEPERTVKDLAYGEVLFEFYQDDHFAALTRLLAGLERNELPDFDKLKKYFAPSGTFAYDEPSGMHLGSFTLRADE